MVVRKRFGQHFLKDVRVVRRIVDAIAPADGERIVEIGPGRGALTWPLLERAGRLEVIEIDRDLAAALREDARGTGRLAVHQGDALRMDFTALRGDGPPLRLVGNLPYNISTPLLFHLLEHRAAITDMHFMLQKEVVDRIIAPPGGKEYGRLTVMLSVLATAERLFEVGPGAFSPPPKVVSAVLRVRPRASTPAPAPDHAGLYRVVTAAFSQRRKTLRNSLHGLFDVDELTACGIDPGWRAEVLTPAQFVLLAERVAARVVQ